MAKLSFNVGRSFCQDPNGEPQNQDTCLHFVKLRETHKIDDFCSRSSMYYSNFTVLILVY